MSTVGRDPARDDSSLEYEQIAHVITCRYTPGSIRRDDEEVEGRGAILIGFQQSETLGVATVHDRRENATGVLKSHSHVKDHSDVSGWVSFSCFRNQQKPCELNQ